MLHPSPLLAGGLACYTGLVMRRAVRFLQLALGLSLVGIVVTTYWALRGDRSPSPSLPVYGSAPEFELVDQDGLAFQSRDLLGHVTLVNFVFTTCPSVCPVLTRQMARLQKATADRGQDVRLVSISVDPLRDTPAVLKHYALRHGADTRRWSFLTGSLEAVKDVVVRGFMSAMSPSTGSTEKGLMEIVHGENVVVLDRAGRLRAFRPLRETEDVAALETIARRLLDEPVPQATVSGR